MSKHSQWSNFRSNRLTQLTMIIEEHSFRHDFIICTKFKQPLKVGLDFTQRYRLGVDWGALGALYI